MESPAASPSNPGNPGNPGNPSNPSNPALIVIDAQNGFEDAAFWGPRNNPQADANIAALLARWRERGWPVVLVRHDSDNPASPLFPGQPGHDFKDYVLAAGDAGSLSVANPAGLLVSKRVNSAFYGEPALEPWLRRNGLGTVVICGITTNHCCETTARMAGNLGFETFFAIDATHTFDRLSPSGETVSAQALSNVSATNLHGEFATVLGTRELLGW